MTDTVRLDGKVAIVTGAGRGIGWVAFNQEQKLRRHQHGLHGDGQRLGKFGFGALLFIDCKQRVQVGFSDWPAISLRGERGENLAGAF